MAMNILPSAITKIGCDIHIRLSLRLNRKQMIIECYYQEDRKEIDCICRNALFWITKLKCLTLFFAVVGQSIDALSEKYSLLLKISENDSDDSEIEDSAVKESEFKSTADYQIFYNKKNGK